MTTTPIFPPTRHGLPLGLGGAPLGNMFAPVPETQVSALFKTALADGCRSFDTAPHYGHGLSELRFGQMLRGQTPDGFALSSKVGRLLTPDSKAMTKMALSTACRSTSTGIFLRLGLAAASKTACSA